MATTFCLMSLLALGAAVATFIENDHGTAYARSVVYDHIWYELILFLTVAQMVAVILKVKLYKRKLVFLFHSAFVVIFIGAALTRYFGFEGTMEIEEGQQAKLVLVEGQEHTLPFAVFLHDFRLDRYPGVQSPMAYESTVSIIESDASSSQPIAIAVNAPLDVQGYRFFQTSYRPDETATILTVNKDPGKNVTYLGYTMLFAGLILNLFQKHSRFRFLLRNIQKGLAPSLLLLFCYSSPSEASETWKASSYLQTYLNDHRENSQKLATSFGELMVQSRMGRVKPMDTLCREIVRKWSGRSSLFNMSATQIILGVNTRPKLWQGIPLFKVKTGQLKKQLGITSGTKKVSFQQCFDENNHYLLEAEVKRAMEMAPFHRGEYEKDLLKIDEKISIFLMTYRGSLLKIFPIPENKENKWLGFVNIWAQLDDQTGSQLQQHTRSFIDLVFARQYNEALTPLKELRRFQQTHGASIYPSPNKVKAEIYYNQLNLFPKLMIVDLLIGLFMMSLAFLALLIPKLSQHKVLQQQGPRLFGLLMILLLFAHLFPLALRTYVSGHAPMSDTYESLLYIAFCSLLAAACIRGNSLFANSASVLMAGIFLFVAHIGSVDPEITNLVPVLQSIWLSIHVSVITASYGFFGISCLVGIVTLILMIFKGKASTNSQEIKHLTAINEAYLILGLTLLVIGNFLGAIWANESWGRYWGWDPKETWAYISIILYTLVIHLRLLKKVYSAHLFATCSVFAYASILMTYFGVNFYLSGKHSYANGDPILIPDGVPPTVILLASLSLIAYLRQKPSSISAEKEGS